MSLKAPCPSPVYLRGMRCPSWNVGETSLKGSMADSELRRQGGSFVEFIRQDVSACSGQLSLR